MALVDVTRPVIIRPTLQIARLGNEFLRRVCFVSLGETKLLKNEFKEVFNYDYKSFLNGYTETTNALNAFFAQASDKSCILLELGRQEGVPLQDGYNTKINYLNGLNWFYIDEFYRWIYYNKWVIAAPANETKDILIAYYNTISTYDAEHYKEWLQLNRLTDSVDNLKKYFTQLDSNWMNGYYAYLANTEDTFKAFVTNDVLTEWLNGLPSDRWNSEAYDIWRDERGTKNVDYLDKLTALDEYLTNTAMPSYIHYLPQQMLRDSRISSMIYQKYQDLQAKTYFFINANNDADFENNQIFKNAKDSKCVAVFFDNTLENYNLAASVAGLFASYKFDISDTNPSSPFNYKAILGVKYQCLIQSLQQNLIQKSLNFMATLANNSVLLNGRYTDSFPIEYRYQWDLVSFEVENALQTLILNGVNNPIYIVKYNQDGIDTIRSNIKATLNRMINWGCVTDFSARINSATGDMENIGDITAIDFNSYVSANPTDYENEIYAGISFYLRIGRYIRQVILSITLG